MFQNIHFIVNHSGQPLENTDNLSKKLAEGDAYPDYMSRLSNYRFFEKCTFCIEGKSYILPLHPVSEFAQQNLTYVQSFSMLDAGRLFYTKRYEANSYMLLFTYEGKGTIEYEGKKYILTEGDGILVDCRKEHYYYTAGRNWKHSVLHFNGSFPDYVFHEISSLGNFSFHQNVEGDYQKNMEKLLEVYDQVIPYRELQISCLLNQLLMELLTDSEWYQEQTSRMPESINMLVRYIGSNYMKPLTLEYLARFSGMSRYYLCKLFKKHTGYSPIEYIIWQRIEHAKSLLCSTSIPANQIGRMVGIEEENYFYRLFKKHTGSSPNAYRNSK